MDVILIPEVVDDGLSFGLAPDDGVLFDGAAHFVFRGEHSTHVSVRAQCDHARLLSNERRFFKVNCGHKLLN